jgi:hypothetical protein
MGHRQQAAVHTGPTRQRDHSVVLVASPFDDVASQLLAEVRRSGAVACLARSAGGCLRVATAVGPDLVLLDSTIVRLAERAAPA